MTGRDGVLAVVVATMLTTSALAQSPQTITEPSMAQRYLAVGRLAMAERELYAAVEANPRQSAPRGELARYLASRGRFKIAAVLLDEAQRFGADPAIVARTLAEMTPYLTSADESLRARVAGTAAGNSGSELASWDGAEATLSLTVREVGTGEGVEGVRATWSFPVLTSTGRAVMVFDLSTEGVAVSSASDPLVPVQIAGAARVGAARVGGNAARTGTRVQLSDLRLGDRVLGSVDAVVDAAVAPGEIRAGVDVFWQLRPEVDERLGTITFPRLVRGSVSGSGAAGASGGGTVQSASGGSDIIDTSIPILLGFPGLFLVSAPGVAPVSIDGYAGRALLRDLKWQLDLDQATVVITR